MCLFDSQILFCKRAGSVGVNAIKHYLKRLWLVAIATILSKTLKIRFLFMSAIAHNYSQRASRMNEQLQTFIKYFIHRFDFSIMK